MREESVVSRLDDHRRDAAGKPLDADQWDRLLRSEEPDEFRVERYVAPENPDLVAFRVVDRAGHVRGFIGFEYDAMEKDLPARTLARVRRAAMPRTDLKLVG